MTIYKSLLSLCRFLVCFLTKNQRQDNYSNLPEPLSEHSRLVHRLGCIYLDENEAKCMQAYLTTVLEARGQDETSAEQSGCIVLEMSEDELQKFASNVVENRTYLFRAIVQGDNNQTQGRKLRIIGKHGLCLFDVIVKSPNSKELLSPTQNKEYIYDEADEDSSRLPKPLSAPLAKVQKTVELYNQGSQNVNDTLPPDLIFKNLLHPLLKCIRQLMNVDTITVLLPTENGQQLAVAATVGLEEEIAQGIRIPLGCGFAGKIAANGEQMIIDDLSKIEVVSPILRNKGIQSMAGVPLLFKDQVIGVFHIGTFRFRQFTKDEVQQLQLIAEHIGLTIEPLLKCWKIRSPNEVKVARLKRIATHWLNPIHTSGSTNKTEFNDGGMQVCCLN